LFFRNSRQAFAATLPSLLVACVGNEVVPSSDASTTADSGADAMQVISDASSMDASSMDASSTDASSTDASSPMDAAPTTTDAAAMPEGGTDAMQPTDGGCMAPSYRAVVLSDNPILYFRLGEPANSANAVDQVTGGPSGKYSAVHSGYPGAIVCDTDTASRFDGTATVDISTVPDFSGRQAFTIEAWVKPMVLSATSFAHILSNQFDDAQGRQGYSLFIGYGGYGYGVERAVNGTLNKAILGIAPVTTRYTHVVGVYDGAMLVLYTDGVAGPTNVDARSLNPKNPPIPAFLGAFSDSNRDFTGDLDEVALYDHALTAARVTAHYTKGAFGY
jgi:hypothetical protein